MKYGYTTETVEKPIDVSKGYELVPLVQEILVRRDHQFTVDGKWWHGVQSHMMDATMLSMANATWEGRPILAIRRRREANPTAHPPASAEAICCELIAENKALKDQVAKAHLDSVERSLFAQAVADELAQAREKHPKFPTILHGTAVIERKLYQLKSASWIKLDAKRYGQVYRRNIQIAAICQRLAEDVLGEKDGQ